MKSPKKKPLSNKVQEFISNLKNVQNSEHLPITPIKEINHNDYGLDKYWTSQEILEQLANELKILASPDNYSFSLKENNIIYLGDNKITGVQKLNNPPENWLSIAADTLKEYIEIYKQPCKGKFINLIKEALKFTDKETTKIIETLLNRENKKIIESNLSISFGSTLNELLSGKKTQTRRLWKQSYINQFIKEYDKNPDTLFMAIDKSFKYGGKEIGKIKFNQRPYLQKLSDIPPGDLIKEGCNNLSKEAFINKYFPKADFNSLVWVIDFTFIPNSPKNNQNNLINQNNKILELSPDYELITDNEILTKLVTSLLTEKIIAIDTETTGLNAHKDKLRLVQLAVKNSPTYIIDCFLCDVKLLQPLLSNKAIKIFHNGKFDLQFFLKENLEINQSFFDTQIAYQVLTAGEINQGCSLKDLAKDILNIDLEKSSQVSNWSDKLTKEQLEYAAKDAKVLISLREILREQLIKADLIKVAKIEFDCILPIAMMEFNGMLLDLEKWQNILKETTVKKNELENKLQDLLKLPSQENTLFDIENKLNLNSPIQLKKALKNKGINLENTSFETLASLAPNHLEIELLLEYRKLNKLLSSFGENLINKINPLTGRLHSQYFQLGASSGRFSCSNPNLQQIPRGKEIRSCFIAAPGNKLVIADYSQIELRIAAEIANDTDMITAYKSGQDLHKLTAAIILNKNINQVTKDDRQIAKSANFGLLYGAGVSGFRAYAQNNYGVKLSESQAKNIIDRFFQRYKGLAKWHQKTKNFIYCKKQTETRTLINRRRVFTDLGLTQALNTPVQGTGADILKLALSKLPLALKETTAKILATVHDEIILECAESEAKKVAEILSTIMISAGKEILSLSPVECEASLGDNWSDK